MLCLWAASFARVFNVTFWYLQNGIHSSEFPGCPNLKLFLDHLQRLMSSFLNGWSTHTVSTFSWPVQRLLTVPSILSSWTEPNHISQPSLWLEGACDTVLSSSWWKGLDLPHLHLTPTRLSQSFPSLFPLQSSWPVGRQITLNGLIIANKIQVITGKEEPCSNPSSLSSFYHRHFCSHRKPRES